MALDRLVSLILRGAELVFAAIVAGVNGEYLHKTRGTGGTQWRFIYTEVVAALGIFFALIWLIPFSSTFSHWPIDFLLSILFWIAFGVLVNLVGSSCGAVFNWNNVHPVHGDQCGKYKATIAFSFLCAILFLASALIGLLWTRKREVRADTVHRRRWYHRGTRRSAV
ncbi:integral membrane protein [Cordyceps fumosorosea ARSEF 2679]|uniref:Integral membrane protein n=1 Tax=Cordyceps fumosorosea (strain ARSEF 2679) TaxID=1081104 RepID=A0A167TM76_CORFA|nr:integral membrane protein [Cordyceps fumosorosea ARSEF 2679]OAA60743.1 integral membrane protein [Cordyceps fumosorosea ARSEF 2679]